VATLAIVAAVLIIFHRVKQGEVDALKNQNDEVNNRITSVRSRVTDHQRVRDELAELRAKEEAITRLENARTGPTVALIELSHLTALGGAPTIEPSVRDQTQRDNASLMYSPGWDAHKIWLTKFTESNRAVTIEGNGMTTDDVGEFMRRLMLSYYFRDVRLVREEVVFDNTTKLSFQHFQILATVRY